MQEISRIPGKVRLGDHEGYIPPSPSCRAGRVSRSWLTLQADNIAFHLLAQEERSTPPSNHCLADTQSLAPKSTFLEQWQTTEGLGMFELPSSQAQRGCHLNLHSTSSTWTVKFSAWGKTFFFQKNKSTGNTF